MNRLILWLAALLTVATATAQRREYATGLKDDDRAYAKIPVKATLLTRDYTVVPSKYSLQKFCPTPQDQGSYATCVGWSTAYAARAICEAIRNNWTSTATITRESFSPVFVYAKIKDADDYNCSGGSCISDALSLMKTTGVCKRNSFSVDCANTISSSLVTEAARYKIDDYFTLFSPSCKDNNERISKTKKAISQNNPVVISFQCYKSFFSATDTWNGVADVNRGNHAMCVVGYDDSMYGGAFLIMNSWGTDWGAGGFVWITYKQFCQFTNWAFEMYVKPQGTTTTITNKPTTAYSYSGAISLQLSTGEKMPLTLGTTGGIKYYRATGSYVSGTRYRIFISNNEPAYVYVLSSDLTGAVERNFPVDSKTSAALTYKSNNIAIPGERSWFEMDDNAGTDYMCVLYSQRSLNLDNIIKYTTQAKGSFYQRVLTALSSNNVPAADTKFATSTVSFSAQSSQPILPIFVEFSHK